MANLETSTLQRFDRLAQSGSIIFRDAPPIHVPSHPFNLQFRIAPSLTKKPQVDIKEAEEQLDKPQHRSDPFANDPPDFVVERVKDKHTLRLNKFCVVRPQLILHTNEFESQIEPLSGADLAAAWSVLCRLESPYVAIYNGGVHGGWSLPHRHMQLLPRPPKDEHDLFPDVHGIQNDSGIIPNIPFRHAACVLSKTLEEEEVFSIYKNLLAAAGVDETDPSHNLIMVREWMLVIPRSHASQDGVNIVNAAGMVGMIWIPSDDVLNVWLQSRDPMEILARFGKPL